MYTAITSPLETDNVCGLDRIGALVPRPVVFGFDATATGDLEE
jgi:hypothetical protein